MVKNEKLSLFREFVEQWNVDFKKRASGGTWALSGFGLQAEVFLLKFFQQISTSTNHDPSKLPALELISDINSLEENKFRLTQVKRSLSKKALKDALTEFYLVTQHCQSNFPQLLDSLEFQISCQYLKTSAKPGDIAYTEIEIKKEPAAPDAWEKMLELLNENQPIIEEGDPRDVLHALLWNEGVRETSGVINFCLGEITNYFDNPSNNPKELAWRLAREFDSNKVQSTAYPNFPMITEKDVEIDEDAESNNSILVGRKPQFKNLKDGSLLERLDLLDSVTQQALLWLNELSFDTDKIPIFWIYGRSGEGKSVLLLQLVSHLVKKYENSIFFHLDTGNDLPELLRQIPDEFGQGIAPVIVLVDDIYQLPDIDTWDENIRNCMSRRIPPVLVMSCGPTEQLELFRHRQKDNFDITDFKVPLLKESECQTFVDFYEQRTGNKRQFKPKKSSWFCRRVFLLAKK